MHTSRNIENDNAKAMFCSKKFNFDLIKGTESELFFL